MNQNKAQYTVGEEKWALKLKGYGRMIEFLPFHGSIRKVERAEYQKIKYELMHDGNQTSTAYDENELFDSKEELIEFYVKKIKEA